MQTTIVALALAGNSAYIAHAGDSRVYHWRDGAIRQLTSDHSEVAELVRMRVVSAAGLRDHPRRNVLTRALGGQLIVRPDFLRQPVQAGDQFLMCTDGLWAEVSDTELAGALGYYKPLEACRRLIDLALERDCSDNVSLQVVRVLSVEAEPEEGRTRGGLFFGILQRIGRS
jgi:serine/threonine protein phosphatase PrpC